MLIIITSTTNKLRILVAVFFTVVFLSDFFLYTFFMLLCYI